MDLASAYLSCVVKVHSAFIGWLNAYYLDVSFVLAAILLVALGVGIAFEVPKDKNGWAEALVIGPINIAACSFVVWPVSGILLIWCTAIAIFPLLGIGLALLCKLGYKAVQQRRQGGKLPRAVAQ